MFRSFDHPQVGIHNTEKPSLTTDPLLLDHFVSLTVIFDIKNIIIFLGSKARLVLGTDNFTAMYERIV
jgi:hypothetical protein